ncbi:putative ribonuclease H-like domain-containing protein [Tanacetum coccineum]
MMALHQAPRAWYETLSTYLLENRFRRGIIDKTLFIKKDKGDILLVQVYVDDIIFGSTKKSLCVEFESLMHKKFQMSSMGELTFFLGLQVMQRDDGIFISQDKYVADILKKFDFVTMKTSSTPIETHKALLKDEEAEDVDVHLYRLMIGSLMYLTASRPDIMFVVCACARDSPFDLEAFSDSDYAGASLDRKSTTGAEYAQMMLETAVDDAIQVSTVGLTYYTLDTEEMEITATIDGKVKIVSKASIRRHHKLEDSDGISNLSTTEIFKQLAFMGTYIAPTFTQKLFNNMRRASKGYTEVDIPLFPTMLIQGPDVQGEGLTVPVESPTQTNVADKAASTGVDVRHEEAATTVTSLDVVQGSGNIDKTPSMPHDSPLPRVYTLGSDEGRMQHNELMDLVTKLSYKVVALEIGLQHTKKVYGTAFTKLIKKVKKLEKTVKTRQARRKARIVVSDDEEDLEDPSKQGRKIAEIDQDPDISLIQHDVEVQGRHENDMEYDFEFTAAEEVYTTEKGVSTAKPVSTAGASVSTASASSAKDKGKAIMEEAKTIQNKTKLQLEQERLGYEEALRLQAEIDDEEMQRIARVQEEASSFNIEEWDNIQARVESDEEFA